MSAIFSVSKLLENKKWKVWIVLSGGSGEHPFHVLETCGAILILRWSH